MRRLLALALAACSSTEIRVQPPDAAPDVAPVEDAGVEASDPCAAGPRAPVCHFAEDCDGGVVYRCYDGLCPTGDAGACSVLRQDSLTDSADVCCERKACVRAHYDRNDRCTRDGGPQRVRWLCPWDGSKVVGAPSPRCEVVGTPERGTDAVDVCCE